MNISFYGTFCIKRFNFSGKRLTINNTLNAALKAFELGDNEQARSCLESVLVEDPSSKAARWGLVKVHNALGNVSGAIEQLLKLVESQPDSVSVLEELVQYSLAHRRFDHALSAYADYLHRHANSAIVYYNYGYALVRAGQYSDALEAYQRALDLGAEQPEEIELNMATVFAERLRDDATATIHLKRAIAHNQCYVPAYFNLGILAERRGDLEHAHAYFNQCLNFEPEYLPAQVRLADAQSFEDQQAPLILKLKQLATNSRDPDLHFALGRALEQCREYSQAIKHYDIANAQDLAVYPVYDHDAVAARFDAIKTSFDAVWYQQYEAKNDAAPVFICGMFRSGSTLVEQMLAAHSAFTPAGEREFFARLVAANMPGYPYVSQNYLSSNLGSWAASYQKESEAIFGKDTRLTDKRPDNFLYLGLIKAMFPAAKIIVTRRAWRDVAWSIYTTRFSSVQHYATDLKAVKHYIDQQAGLIAHWQSLFGADMHLVDYEELVTFPQPVISSLLDFLGEPWEEQCLRFDKLKNAVRTESVWQVRQPLYTSSVGRSAPFAKLRPSAFEYSSSHEAPSG